MKITNDYKALPTGYGSIPLKIGLTTENMDLTCEEHFDAITKL